MRQLDPDLWIAEAPLRFLGLEVGVRMTVVRLPGSVCRRLAARVFRARLYAAPGLDAKRPDLEIAGVLGDEPDGCPFVNDVAFFHRPSATLIATNLAFNVGASCPAVTRFAFRLGGTYGCLSGTLLERVMVRDRQRFKDPLERILEWRVGRVVVAHGDVCEQGGREPLARGYVWTLRGNPRRSSLG